jgi:hypothetical protein
VYGAQLCQIFDAEGWAAGRGSTPRGSNFLFLFYFIAPA